MVLGEVVTDPQQLKAWRDAGALPPRGDLAWAGAGGAALSSSSRFMAQRRQGRALLGWRAGLPGIRAALRVYGGPALVLRAAPETRLAASEACKPCGRVSLGEAEAGRRQVRQASS